MNDDPVARRPVPRWRSKVVAVMFVDILAVLAAVPASLALSKSIILSHALSAEAVSVWLAVALLGHMAFRLNGLYGTVWRLASTQDFINISRACLMLGFGLYLFAVTAHWLGYSTGLHERQFIVFFLVIFVVISAPRLVFRYLRDGGGWQSAASRSSGPGTRPALFIGRLKEADSVIRLARANSFGDIAFAGILAVDGHDLRRAKVQGVPILGGPERLASVLGEADQSAHPLRMIVFGQRSERDLADFADLVRIARRNDVEVSQFLGLSRFRSRDNALGEVELERVLKRAPLRSESSRLGRFCGGQRILVTGGAGSIGSALVQRALDFGADHVLVVDRSEFAIFRLYERLPETARSRVSARVVDINDEVQLSRIIAAFRPGVIFHAAALKHVPILEQDWISAIQTNVFGTMTCAELAARHHVPQFVLISSDKAVEPSSVLGQTKRMAEQIVNALHFAGRSRNRMFSGDTSFVAVRFGNVFDSDGSVSTIFRRQIELGQPLTITDPRMTRYFMTMTEAVDLVITAAADAGGPRPEGDHAIYMLDMGEPVQIIKIAETMIKLAGKEPYKEVPIVITRVRPGEKLSERLHADGEHVTATSVPNILGLNTGVFTPAEIAFAMRSLKQAIAKDDKKLAMGVMNRMFRAASAGMPAHGENELDEAQGF
jgi:FlaA1/EpsC-like NDP-sugar epimerase